MVRITFPNGSYYVPEKDFTTTLFQSGGTASGTYKVKKNGILFMKGTKEPFLFLVADDNWGRFFVSCSKDGGKIRYMFSTCSIDEKLTGLDKLTSGGKRDFATMVWDQIAEKVKHSI